MPELPEVETTCRGITPHVLNHVISSVEVRQPRLRWAVPSDLDRHISEQRILQVSRRGKYILLRLVNGSVLMHLGMSGSLRVLPLGEPFGKHDHVDIRLNNGKLVRFNDPRRFGAVLWVEGNPLLHPLLLNLGPEPLGTEFTGEYLYERSRGRNVSVKQFIMDSKVVVGVGNIYANEALFLSGIAPHRAAGRISKARYATLTQNIRQVLASAIEMGGTTLRDFTRSDGNPGYFRQQLLVYGRAGLPCKVCGNVLREKRIGARSSVYCSDCQH